MKITIEVRYEYVSDLGEFKRAVLRRKNFQTTKTDSQLGDLQEEVQGLIEEDGYPVELDEHSHGKGKFVYIFELMDQFDEKEIASELAHKIMDKFCEKAV